MSIFSPESFLDMQITESNDTKIVPIPVGEYMAAVKDVKVRPWQSKNDPSKAGIALDIVWLIDDASVKEFLGREEVTAKQGIMLDMTEAGGLDVGKGKNVSLGRLREAVGLNTPGQPFSFTMLSGRAAKVKVEHRVDGDQIYSEIKAVAKL